MKLTVAPALPSPAKKKPQERSRLKVALLQYSWQPDPEKLKARITNGVEMAAKQGAEIVFLPELSLSRYPADTLPEGTPSDQAEELENGPTFSFLKQLAMDHGIFVHGSLYEKAGLSDGRGLNSAIVVSPEGSLVARTPKLHIPVTAGYFEDKYFQPGPADNPYPVFVLDLASEAKLGLPTCWDEWFPEVARAYGLGGADILCYPTAIGSEPDHPDFDSEPLWRQSIVGHAIANGLFIVVPNRYGSEGIVTFYGSSFIVDPYGRILAQAAREGDEVLVAELDLDQRRDWLDLFPFFATRRPETYGQLSEKVNNPRAADGDGELGGIAGLKP